MGEELVDFQTALQDLQMTEAELSNLVARGELRVIRSGGKPMFRPADIQGLKQERETDPTIIIPASAPQADPAQSGPITIDLPEDIGDLDESAATVVASSPSESASDTQSDTGTEEIVFTDDLEILPLEDDASQTSALTAADAPAIDEEATVIEEDATSTSVEDDGIQVIDDDGDIIATTASGRRRAVSARSAPSVSRRMSAAYDVQPGNPVMSVVLVIGTLVMLFTASVVAVMVIHEYDVSYPLKRDANLDPGTKYLEEKHAVYVPGYLKSSYKALWADGEPGEKGLPDDPTLNDDTGE
jgi:hypothetical protein